MGPYKCPDCGVWWAGLEHRCAKPTWQPSTDTTTTTVRCTCGDSPTSTIPGSWVKAYCPLHDVVVWF